MSAIHAILLVPAEGDPHGLLREGPCGARPPMGWQAWPDEPGWWRKGHPRDYEVPSHAVTMTGRKPVGPPRIALVLAWEGEVVVEGVDRLQRCPAFWGDARADVGQLLARCSDEVRLHRRGRVKHLGALILLDAKGQEVTP